MVAVLPCETSGSACGSSTGRPVLGVVSVLEVPGRERVRFPFGGDRLVLGGDGRALRHDSSLDDGSGKVIDVLGHERGRAVSPADGSQMAAFDEQAHMHGEADAEPFPESIPVKRFNERCCPFPAVRSEAPRRQVPEPHAASVCYVRH